MDNFRPVQSSIGRKVSLVDTKLAENGAGWDDDDDDCDVDNGDHGDVDDWGWSTPSWQRMGPGGTMILILIIIVNLMITAVYKSLLYFRNLGAPMIAPLALVAMAASFNFGKNI